VVLALFPTALSANGSPRIWLVGAVATLCALAVLACSRPKRDGPVRLTYWEKWTGAEAAAMQAAVDAFNASQTRIRVDFVSMAQIDRKLIAATAGGAPPDLAGIWLPQIAAFADRDALLPLDPFIAADARRAAESAGRPFDPATAVPDFLARYVPVYGTMGVVRGTVYALPITPSVVALHWNKRLFREAGLDPDKPPRTVAELDELARRLTRRHPETGAITQLGFLPQEPGWWMWANPLWFGGSFLDANGEISAGTDPQNLAALGWVESYTRTFGLDALQRFTSGFGSFGSPQSAFFTGKVAMVLQGVWLNNYIGQFAPGLDYGVAPWPAVDQPADAPFTVADADMIVIPRGAKHPEEAWEFIRYLSSANLRAERREDLQGVELVCFLQEKNSPLRAWSPYFEISHPHPHIAFFRRLSESPNAVAPPAMGVWPEYTREWTTASDRVRLLQATPDEAVADVQRRMTRSWRWHRDSLQRQAKAGEGTP
jgi:ABC-type glycerol-3-phosphate transport system substrate-binding protein